MIITRSVLTVLLVSLLFLGVFSITYAHNGIDHDAPQEVQLRQELRFLLIKQIAILLLEKQKMQQHSVPSPIAQHKLSGDMSIKVEVHNGKTHVHVNQPNMSENSFFLDGIVVTDKAAVLEAIAVKLGLTQHNIEPLVTFPESETMINEEAEHDEHGDDDHLSVHIMADGTVMDHNGAVVANAVILADGKIKLSDGSIVEPEFDLR